MKNKNQIKIKILFLLLVTMSFKFTGSAQSDVASTITGHMGAGNNTWYCGWDGLTTFPLNIKHVGDYPINFATLNTNRMFINQSTSSGTFGGYVGIGTGFTPNSANEPLTRLHIGSPDPLYTINGWRPWMKEGLFVHKGTDIAYFGLMDTSAGDRQDAILAWGDNLPGKSIW